MTRTDPSEAIPLVITYPRFLFAVRELDLDALARSANVSRVELDAVIEGGRAPSLSIRDRLARALDADARDLFRPFFADHDLSPALSRAPSYFVSDPDTLRVIGQLS